ncbi:hypothetical protein EK904_007324 [Melospiza melodia maxima]|nr:hypothetical protein EK904_007324 [Melospiza melodia maxima]
MGKKSIFHSAQASEFSLQKLLILQHIPCNVLYRQRNYQSVYRKEDCKDFSSLIRRGVWTKKEIFCSVDLGRWRISKSIVPERNCLFDGAAGSLELENEEGKSVISVKGVNLTAFKILSENRNTSNPSVVLNVEKVAFLCLQSMKNGSAKLNLLILFISLAGGNSSKITSASKYILFLLE